MSSQPNVEYIKVSVSLSPQDGSTYDESEQGPESVRIPSYVPADDLGRVICEALAEEKSSNDAATIEYMIAVSSVYSPPFYGTKEMVHSAMRVRVPREVPGQRVGKNHPEICGERGLGKHGGQSEDSGPGCPERANAKRTAGRVAQV